MDREEEKPTNAVNYTSADVADIKGITPLITLIYYITPILRTQINFRVNLAKFLSVRPVTVALPVRQVQHSGQTQHDTPPPDSSPS